MDNFSTVNHGEPFVYKLFCLLFKNTVHNGEPLKYPQLHFVEGGTLTEKTIQSVSIAFSFFHQWLIDLHACWVVNCPKAS